MTTPIQKTPGLREHKRRQTLTRIVQVGLELFLAKGYEATTLDEIAAAAGISRRTIFHYFKSKDEILLAYLRIFADTIKDLVTRDTSCRSPLEAAFAALSKFIAGFQESRMVAIARLMRQSEVLRTRRHAGYFQFEQAIHEGLCQLYPERERDGLKLIAMVSISPVRLAVDTWLQQEGKRPLVTCIQDALDMLRAELDRR